MCFLVTGKLNIFFENCPNSEKVSARRNVRVIFEGLVSFPTKFSSKRRTTISLFNWPGISSPDSCQLKIFSLLFSNFCFAAVTLDLKTAMDRIWLKFHFKNSKCFSKFKFEKHFTTECQSFFLSLSFQQTFETDTLFLYPLMAIRFISHQILIQNRSWKCQTVNEL